MALTLQEVEHVARLARLALSDEEKRAFTGELNAILAYVQKLNELDTEGVEPMAHAVPLQNVFREDLVKPSLTPDEALSNAPERSGDFFRVPRILEEE